MTSRRSKCSTGCDSDTSPLTYLHQIERFVLLSALYEEVVIPPAVERELKAAAHLHENLDWSLLLVVKPKSWDAVTSLYAFLDFGEAEAIVVAPCERREL